MIDYTMNDGHTIPAVGYGVFLMSPAEVEAHLPEAIEAGYRHIDTANAYFNEKAVGRVRQAQRHRPRRVLHHLQTVPAGLRL